MEALSDAQFVAPAAKTVDLHSVNHRNSFLYVFDYQTKFGDFPQVSKLIELGGKNRIITIQLLIRLYEFCHDVSIVYLFRIKYNACNTEIYANFIGK